MKHDVINMEGKKTTNVELSEKMLLVANAMKMSI